MCAYAGTPDSRRAAAICTSFYNKVFIIMLLLAIVKMAKETLFSQEKLHKCYKIDLGSGPSIFLKNHFVKVL